MAKPIVNERAVLLFKDNSVIFRWFKIFFILLPMIISISYQEMNESEVKTGLLNVVNFHIQSL